MAGIGFRIQRIIDSKKPGSLACAYAYSAIISSGPWMLATLSLIGIGLFMSASSGLEMEHGGDADIFSIVTTYVYAGSIVFGGIIHMGLSRYISDWLYSGKMEEILPTFLYSAVLTLICGLLTAGPWFSLCGLSAADAICGFLMFQSLSLTWLCMVFLSAAKGYNQIVLGFLDANALGAGLAIMAYRYFALTGALAGYSLGQFFLALWLSWRIFREFPSYNPCSNSLLVFIWDKRQLAAIGFLFNMGIWVDKFIVWHSALGRNVIGWFSCADIYDTCLFCAYLTTIPAMALFLIRIETSFYRNYTIYFTAVTCGGDLAAIADGKEKIRANVRLSIDHVLRSQGIFTLFLVVIAPLFAPYLGLSSAEIPTLRWAFLAAFLQALLLFLLIFLLYFDWQTRALWLSLLFVASNALFTWISLGLGKNFLGLGYLLSLLVSLVFGFILFERALDRLEFETFAKQQMVV